MRNMAHLEKVNYRKRVNSRRKSWAKGTNKNVADYKLKYEDYKNVCLMQHIWSLKWVEWIQDKNQNTETYRINKVSLFYLR